jgi:hypothetical protein
VRASVTAPAQQLLLPCNVSRGGAHSVSGRVSGENGTILPERVASPRCDGGDAAFVPLRRGRGGLGAADVRLRQLQLRGGAFFTHLSLALLCWLTRPPQAYLRLANVPFVSEPCATPDASPTGAPRHRAPRQPRSPFAPPNPRTTADASLRPRPLASRRAARAAVRRRRRAARGARFRRRRGAGGNGCRRLRRSTGLRLGRAAHSAAARRRRRISGAHPGARRARAGEPPRLRRSGRAQALRSRLEFALCCGACFEPRAGADCRFCRAPQLYYAWLVPENFAAFTRVRPARAVLAMPFCAFRLRACSLRARR